jgi:predicted RNA-binding protein with TRAM domain
VICGGDGVVLSEASAAVDVERHLRQLAASAPRTKAFKVELNAKVASVLIGPGASRLQAIEEETKRRFLLVSREDVPTEHYDVLGKGTYESLAPKAPVEEGAQVELKLGEVGRHDVTAGIGKHEGLTICVGGAAGLVGKKAKVRIERVLDRIAYASLVGGAAARETPITAEGEAEKPTRKPPVRKGKAEQKPETPDEPEALTEEPEAVAEEPEPELDAEAEAEAETEQPAAEDKPRKKTRRGSRGGKRRRKKPAEAQADGAGAEAAANGEGPRIHLPDPGLGREEAEEAPAEAVAAANGDSQDGAEQPKPKKKTRRGSRGGRRRRKPAAKSPSGSSE